MELAPPSVVTFEVTYACNLSCNMCQTHWLHKDQRFNSHLNKQGIIDTARRLNIEEGAHYFRFVGAEPLLHPEIVEIVTEVSKIGTTSLTTNGTLLTTEMAEALVNSGLSELLISYHTPNEHYRGMPPKLILDKTMKGINAIETAKNKFNRRLNVIVTNVITPANYNQLFNVNQRFNNLDVTVAFFPVHAMRKYMTGAQWNGQVAECFGTDEHEPSTLNFWQTLVFRCQLQTLVGQRRYKWLWPVYVLASVCFFILRDAYALMVYRPCIKPSERMCIRADGKITSCEFLRTIEMGSITDNQLWNTPQRRQLIDLTQKGELPICRQCSRKSIYRKPLWPLRLFKR